ncbi:MAG: flagellin, partial [Clostridiales bacterium]|nr:flagellin [Clostridiales bacterium]
FQVGANAGQAIAINNVVDAKASSLGNAKFAAPVDSTADVATITDLAGVTINGAAIGTITGTTTAEFAAAAAADKSSAYGQI